MPLRVTEEGRLECPGFAWRTHGLPHKGWSCLEVDDQEEPSFTCEACGFPAVRFVHVMTHPDAPDPLRVGCVCAGHLEDDYAAAKGRDRIARNAANRRTRALTRWCDPGRWKRSARGNLWRKADGVRVVVFPDPHHDGAWKAAIGERFGTRSYPTAADAIRGVFARLRPLKHVITT